MKADGNIFEGHYSRCEERQKIIVSSENRSKHIAENCNCNMVRQYKIDDDVISSKTVDKCDYLVLNDDKKTAYLIELKGSELSHAIDQLNQTKKAVLDSLKDYQFYYRIVFSGSATHSINRSKFLSWQKNCGKVNGVYVAQMKRIELKENI